MALSRMSLGFQAFSTNVSSVYGKAEAGSAADTHFASAHQQHGQEPHKSASNKATQALEYPIARYRNLWHLILDIT